MDMHGEMGPIADKMAKAMADAPGLGQVSLELANHAFGIPRFGLEIPQSLASLIFASH